MFVVRGFRGFGAEYHDRLTSALKTINFSFIVKPLLPKRAVVFGSIVKIKKCLTTTRMGSLWYSSVCNLSISQWKIRRVTECQMLFHSYTCDRKYLGDGRVKSKLLGKSPIFGKNRFKWPKTSNFCPFILSWPAKTSFARNFPPFSLFRDFLTST